MPTVNIAPYIRNQYFTDNGIPLAGGLLNCYNGGSAGGTGDRKDTYSDAAGTVLNANPIVLDAAGRAKIYLKSGPYLFVLTDSTGSVIWSEDGITTSSITTSVNVMTDLKALAGGSSSIIRTLGRLTVNDGGGWWYYWSESSSATDDGGMVVQPSSLPATGRWIGFLPESRELNLRVYGAVCDGTTDDSAALTLCNEYCSDNGCIMVIDSNVYEATNVSFLDDTGANLTPIKLLPNAQFRYGNFNPSLKVIIDENDHTQHFNCAVAYTPTLDTHFLYPEWFGETWAASHPITTAAIRVVAGVRKICDLLYAGSLEVGERLDANGGADIEGNVDVEGTLDAHGACRSYSTHRIDGAVDINSSIDVSGTFDLHGNGRMYGTAQVDTRLGVGCSPNVGIMLDVSGNLSVVAGSDSGATTRTNNTNKTGGVFHPPYSGTDSIFPSVLGVATSGVNNVIIGGGMAAMGAATKVSINTAADTSTPVGTERVTIENDGSVRILQQLQVGSPTGGYKGAGAINAKAVYDDNVQLTGYVLDRAFNEKFNIDEWGKKSPAVTAFIDRADLMLNIDKYCEFIKTNRMLPTFERVEKSEEIPSTGVMIQKLWEVVEIQAIQISELNDRIKKLENR